MNPWGVLSTETDHFHKFLNSLWFYIKWTDNKILTDAKTFLSKPVYFSLFQNNSPKTHQKFCYFTKNRLPLQYQIYHKKGISNGDDNINIIKEIRQGQSPTRDYDGVLARSEDTSEGEDQHIHSSRSLGRKDTKYCYSQLARDVQNARAAHERITGQEREPRCAHRLSARIFSDLRQGQRA